MRNKKRKKKEEKYRKRKKLESCKNVSQFWEAIKDFRARRGRKGEGIEKGNG